ncbi:hypothetical protein BGP_2737 [Beggiatoa sp. PS]|nr:hypothetical protein BGP_2737 [Beggiatoa sp. PS]
MSKKVFIRLIRVMKRFVFLTKNLVNHGMVGKRADRKVPKLEYRTARLPTLQASASHAPFLLVQVQWMDGA